MAWIWLTTLKTYLTKLCCYYECAVLPEQRALGYQHRCDIYITKPFDCVELGMSINNLVQHLNPASATDQTQQNCGATTTMNKLSLRPMAGM